MNENKKSSKLSVILTTIACIIIMIPIATGMILTEINNSYFREIHNDVIAQNEKRLSKPMKYNVCELYTSTSDDKDTLISVLTDIKVLSDEICKDAESEYDKVVKLTYYVAENIYYDKIAAETNVNDNTISLENILKTKKTVCAGYSNLFSALCSMQDIYCLNLKGGTIHKNEDKTADLRKAPMNHEWNAVQINDEWLFIDTTWCSNNTYDKHGYNQISFLNTNYSVMSMDIMSYDHRIDRVDYRNFKETLEKLLSQD